MVTVNSVVILVSLLYMLWIVCRVLWLVFVGAVVCWWLLLGFCYVIAVCCFVCLCVLFFLFLRVGGLIVWCCAILFCALLCWWLVVCLLVGTIEYLVCGR